ncbi:MAG: PstS family phosphate ABC transporter substrate-binding protein [bacterium]
MFKNTTLKLSISLVALTIALSAAGCTKKSDHEEAGKSAVGKIDIQNLGSDTMVNLAQAWAEEYAKVEPTVSVEVSGGGSGTGIAALINGTVDIANASRKMTPEELRRARENTGKEPIEFVVGYDALAVYVHKDNPLEEISLEQLAEIYGEGGTITKWSQLGISHPACSSDEIIRVSRQSNSGTYFYFRETVLGKQRDFKLGSRDLHGSKDVVELVGTTPCAIGYSGMGYATDEVRMLRISKKQGAPAYKPNMENELSGSYPISRPLHMYSLGEPTGAVKKYLEWVLSDEGQKIVETTGYVPVPKEERQIVAKSSSQESE